MTWSKNRFNRQNEERQQARHASRLQQNNTQVDTNEMLEFRTKTCLKLHNGGEGRSELGSSIYLGVSSPLRKIT